MDFKIANALNLSPELVLFNRRAYQEEISSLSSSDELLGRGGLPGCYGGYFPMTSQDNLGSGSNHSPGRSLDSPDEAVCSIDDDFSHALFAQEQMLIDGFDNAEPKMAEPTQLDHSHRLHITTTTKASPNATQDRNTCTSSLMEQPQPVDTAMKRPSSLGLEINYASTPGLMVGLPSQTPLPSIPRPYDAAVRRRQVDIAVWQRVLLHDAFQADHNHPGRQRLRELSDSTHLSISIISIWFAEKRRRLRMRLKFGFSFPRSFSRASRPRTPEVTTIGHARCN